MHKNLNTGHHASKMNVHSVNNSPKEIFKINYIVIITSSSSRSCSVPIVLTINTSKRKLTLASPKSSIRDEITEYFFVAREQGGDNFLVLVSALRIMPHFVNYN